MAEQATQKTNTKHVYAESGRVVSKKRNLSGEQQTSEDKTHHRDQDSDVSEEEDGITKPGSSTENDQNDSVATLVKALTDIRVQQVLKATFNSKIDQVREELHDEIKAISEGQKETDTRVSKLELEMDEYKQRDKENNIVIAGISTRDSTRERITDLLNEKIEAHIRREDIKYILKLKTRAGEETNRVRVAFASREVKRKVFKKKNKLEGSSLWIGDDLTPYRLRMEYLARRAVKEGRATQTWTFDGKTFLKEFEDERPRIIKTPLDLP